MLLDTELAIVIFVLSIVSGIGSYLHGCRSGRLKRSYYDCITEVVLALVAGFVVAFFSDAYKIHPSITCASALLAANNGAEFLSISKTVMHKYLVGFTDDKK